LTTKIKAGKKFLPLQALEFYSHPQEYLDLFPGQFKPPSSYSGSSDYDFPVES